MNKKSVVSGIIAIVVALVGIVIYALSGQSNPIAVTDYSSCVKAGNPSEAIYPAQCVASDGRTYIQPITTDQSNTAVPNY